MTRKRILSLTEAAMIAAMYVVLTYLAQLFGLAGGAVQVRLSEALTVLPFFTSAAIPGLFAGCLLANLLIGCAVWDIVFGSLATLLAAILCRLLCRRAWSAAVPNIVINTAVLPFVLLYVYGAKDSLPFLFVTVGVGELISCGIFGTLLSFALQKSPIAKKLGFDIKTNKK